MICLPNEPPRTGSAREHRTLFLTAARVLRKISPLMDSDLGFHLAKYYQSNKNG